MGYGEPLIDGTGVADIDVRRGPHEGIVLPNLGLATTRQLLEELVARGETVVPSTEDSTVLLAMSRATLKGLSEETLAYRTVDNG